MSTKAETSKVVQPSAQSSQAAKPKKEDPDIPAACLLRAGPSLEHKTIKLDKPEVVVGRSKDNDFCIPDLLISRKHAIFKFRNGEWTVECLGMNGIMVNHITLPKNEPCPLSHLDMVEFGAGSKFIYAFRLDSKDGSAAKERDGQPPAKVANRARLSVGNRNYPSAKDSPAAYEQWMRSKKGLERTLMEESVVIDQQLEEQSTRKDQLLLEQKKLNEQAEQEKQQLLAQFAKEKKELEERVQHGEVEKTELQREKQALEDRMAEALKQFQDDCARKTVGLEHELERANAEKQSLLEQKEFVVQQLTREKQVLEECLEEERRQKTAATVAQANAEAELAAAREAVRRLEEEKKQLEQKGNEDQTRMREVEEALQAKEREIIEFQSINAIGLEMYDALQYAQGGDAMLVVGEAAGGPADVPAVNVEAEVEKALQEERRRQQMTLMERMESIYECSICSEVIVVAIGLNCSHAFCQTCINTWKRSKRECPVCRTPITMENRQHLIDNAISDNYSQMPEDIQQKRKELVRQRQELAQRQNAEALPSNATAAAANPVALAHARMVRRFEEYQAAMNVRASERRGTIAAAPAAVAHRAPTMPQPVPRAQVPAANVQAGPRRPPNQARAPPAAIPAEVTEDVVVLSSGDEAERTVQTNVRRRRGRARPGDSVLIVEEPPTLPRSRIKRTICQTCGTVRTGPICDYCHM